MKKMSKILCSVLVMCGAFSMSAMSVYATGDILIDEPIEMEEAVTTVVSSEIIESGELPVISEDMVIEYSKPEITVPEQTTSEDNAEITVRQESEAPTLGLPEGNATIIEDVSTDVVDRQFIAIQSKNGNTFYIVIDKNSKGKEAEIALDKAVIEAEKKQTLNLRRLLMKQHQSRKNFLTNFIWSRQWLLNSQKSLLNLKQI